MTIRHLDALFRPTSVALVGASTRSGALGQVIAENLLNAGFTGPVLPVNPKGGAVSSTLAYETVEALPLTPDLAVICTPPDTVPGIIDALGHRGTKGAVVITAGFGELGAEGLRLQGAMLEAARPHCLRIIGPNCLGILVPGLGLNASFAPGMARAGDLALVAQSGAIVTALLDWATARSIGFSHIVSLGAAADVDFGDMLDYLARETTVRAILLYVEAITDARKFMSAARAASRLKPIVVLKAGRHAEGAKAARSHTGALAGADAVYDAAFRRAGMLRVFSLDELFAAVETLSRRPPIAGDRLAILTNGGGIGVLATDRLIDRGGRLATLTADTLAALDAVLPRTWSRGNPVDIIGDAPGSRYASALDALLKDPGVDAVLVLNCPTAIADSGEAARAVIATYAAAPRRTEVGLLTAWLGAEAAQAARDQLETANLATFETPDQAIDAFGHQIANARNRALLLEAPPTRDGIDAGARRAARRLVERALAQGLDWLDEADAKALVQAYGIPAVETVRVETVEEACAQATRLGYPVALKIHSPDITHKSDVGGVALNLSSESAVAAAAAAIKAKVADKAPGARVAGFMVQPMAARPGAHELIVGLVQDPLFGPVILFGQGGTAVEVIADKALALPPLNAALARDLVARTRVARLLAGYRDRPAADAEAIVGALLALGDLAADLPEVVELDINPLWADARGVMALDARVRVAHVGRPGSNFAIRPYPRELETVLMTRTGERHRVRAIRPDDEPLLQDMVRACEPEDIRMRFFSALRALPHALATRLTQIDYAREMAFVAFAEEGSDQLTGVVRLVCDPDNERGEYAVIVRSDRKGTGLGYALMTHIIDYARARGLKEIFGDVLRENEPMLAMAAELGFKPRAVAGEPGLVEVALALGP